MNEVTKIEHDDTAPAVQNVDPMVSMIERVVLNPAADTTKLEQMLAMKERMDAKVAKAAFDAAFSKASAEFPDIPLNGENKHQKTKYALLKDILSGVRPVLSRHGLALSFSTEVTTESVVVTAELSHECGYSKTNSMPLPRDTGAGRNAVQAVGSSQTYGQRYTAQAILGLSLGDDTEDDGNSSGKHEQPETRKQFSWAETITQDMPENSTPREKAEAISQAICDQFKRMKGIRQIDNEWDRRASLINSLEEKHNDLWGNVIEAYESRRHELEEIRAEKERG